MKRLLWLLFLSCFFYLGNAQPLSAQNYCSCGNYVGYGPVPCAGEGECQGEYWPSYCGGWMTNCYNCQDQAGSGLCCWAIYYSASTGKGWGECGGFGNNLNLTSFEVADGLLVPNCNGSFTLVLPGRSEKRAKS
jgi:hypothetical protein